MIRKKVSTQNSRANLGKLEQAQRQQILSSRGNEPVEFEDISSGKIDPIKSEIEFEDIEKDSVGKDSKVDTTGDSNESWLDETVDDIKDMSKSFWQSVLNDGAARAEGKMNLINDESQKLQNLFSSIQNIDTREADASNAVLPKYDEDINLLDIDPNKLSGVTSGSKDWLLGKIKTRLKELDAERIDGGKDLQEARNKANAFARNYKISSGYKEKMQGEYSMFDPKYYKYKVPDMLGTSASSGLATVAQVAVHAAPAMISKSIKAKNPWIGIGAAVVGAATDVYSTIWSRNRESLSEVANGYYSTINDFAKNNGISTKDIANIGRQKLRTVTGESYSTDPNSDNYRSDEDVVKDILAYDIPLKDVLPQGAELDKMRAKAKTNLRDTYEHNMALSTSDLAQTALIVPGAGKVFSKILYPVTKVTGKVGKATTEVIDKAMSKVLTKSITPVAKETTRKYLKYVAKPVAKMVGSATLEGIEEVTQSMISSRIANEEGVKTRNLLNPIDQAVLQAQNLYMASKGLGVLTGIIKDPTVTSQDQLIEEFKGGFVIGAILGGGAQTVSAANDFRSYGKGRNTARQVFANHVKDRDDLYKYTEYAKKANGKLLNKEAFMDAIDQQLNDNIIPEGWTAEEVKAEKENIKEVYDLINNSNLVKQISKEDRPYAAAILKKKNDDVKEAAMHLTQMMLKSAEIDSKIGLDVQNSSEINYNTDEENTLLNQYLTNKVKSDAIDSYINTLERTKETIANSDIEHDSKNIDNELKFMKTLKGEIDTHLNSYNESINSNDKLSLQKEALSIDSREDLQKLYINHINAKSLLDKTVSDRNSIMKSDKLNDTVNKYKESLAKDEAIEAATQTKEKEEEQLETPDEYKDETVESEVTTVAEEDAEKPVTMEEEVTPETTEETNVPVESKVEPKKEDTETIDPSMFTQGYDYDTGEDFTADEELGEGDLYEEKRTAKTEKVQANPEVKKKQVTEQPVEKKRVISDELYAKSVEIMRKKLGNLNVGIDPEMIAHGAIIAAYHVENGARKLADFSRAVIDVLGDNVRPYLKSFYQSAKNLPEVIEQGWNEEMDSDADVAAFDVNNFDKPVIETTPQKVTIQDASLESDGYQPANSEEGTSYAYGTLFYQMNETPMFKGYENGIALNEYLSTPGNLAQSEVTAIVGKPNSKFGKYDPKDETSWDNAAIYIQIKAKDGRKYIAALKTVAGAKALYEGLNKTLSQSEEDRIRQLRNTILRAKINDPDCVVTFTTVKSTHGFINNNKGVNRKLTDIKGMHIDSDLHKLDISKFGIGKGYKDGHIVMNYDGQTIPGSRGGSGKIYYYVDGEYTLDGEKLQIKLNEGRFRSEDEISPLAKYLSRVVLYGETNHDTLYPDDVLQLVMNYGSKTVIDPTDPGYEFLADKQFYVDTAKGYAQIGKEQIPIKELRTEQGEIRLAKFINDNLHWNTDKNILFKPLSNRYKLLLDTEEVESYEIAPGFVVDLEDVGLIKKDGKFIDDPNNPNGLTAIAYLIKHGYLLSDVEDRIADKPFVYIDCPVISHPETKSQVELDVKEKQPTTIDPTMFVVGFEGEEFAKPATETKEEYDPYSDFDSDEAQSFLYGTSNPGARKIMNNTQLENKKNINTTKAVKWLKSRLGLTEEEIEVVDGVIRQFANGSAIYGLAKKDSIEISNQAVEGVQYHEAWHRISLLILTPEQRTKLYKEFKLNNPQYSKLDDKALEEVLADQFMDYMIGDMDKGIRYYVKKMFRNIKRFLRINTYDINPSDLNSIFDKIKYGDFRKYQLDKESIEAFTKVYGEDFGATYKVGPNNDVTLKYFPLISDFNSAVDSLKACLFFVNGVQTIEDIQNLNKAKLKVFLQSMISSNRTTEQNKLALQEIVDNFDIFMHHLDLKLDQQGIVGKEEKIRNEFSEREDNGISEHLKESWEYDKKQNALAGVKMFISTIQDTYTTYVEKDGIKTRIIQTRINSITGLPMLVDFDTAFALCLRNLSTVENFDITAGQDVETTLMGRVNRLAKINPFFDSLAYKLSRVDDENLKTQILQTFKCEDKNYVEVNYVTENNETTFNVDDGINKRALKQYPSTWSDNLFNSSLIIHDNESITPNITEISYIIVKYNKLVSEVIENKNLSEEDVDGYVIQIVSIFNQIGITIDNDTFANMLGDKRVDSLKQILANNKQGAIKYIFNGTLSKLTGKWDSLTKQTKDRPLNQLYMGLGKNSFINKLAESQALTHPSESETSVLGPNNALMQTKTLNCFVSDQIRWLNNRDKQAIDLINNDVYCNNSIIKNAIVNNVNTKLKLNTFANFYGNDRNDKGRKYTEISPIEDYLAKMAFTRANHIIFPTMADKGTWLTISGIGMFNNNIVVKQNDSALNVRFDTAILKQSYLNWLDEFNTVKAFFESGETGTKVKNYSNKGNTLGKGGLFRHYTGYFITKEGKKQWVDLNESLKQAYELGTITETLQNIESELFSDKSKMYDLINGNLLVQLENEINTCVDLGILERDKDNPKQLKNRLLDTTSFKEVKNFYDNNQNPNIAQKSERFAILTLIGNHMVNYNFSVIETEKVFTGDTAFFKNNDDKIKRLGAVLSTGDNLRTQWSTSSKKQKYIDLCDNMNGKQTYTCAIFNDNEIPSAQHEELVEKFTYCHFRNLLMQKENLTEEQVDGVLSEYNKAISENPVVYDMALSMAETDAEGYGLNDSKTKGRMNQADAAVYLSPSMYRNIVTMLGEWSDSVEEAFNIMEGDADWLSDPELYRKSLGVLMKPLKTTYFGFRYDENLKHNIPVFNKMAQFPLFKVLATGDNREIYDRMTATGKYIGLKPIDQIAFESAVKVGIEGAADFYSDVTNESINDLTNIHTTQQYYRNLRRQLITEPHKHDRTLFGTQVSTVAVSNLVLDRVYKQGTSQQITGHKIKEQLFGTINAIAKKGFREVEKMFLDKDGNLDIEKTSKQLIKDSKASNMGVDMEQALQYDKKTKSFSVPLSALPDNKWLETDMISTIDKKAIDIELPGGAFIQMSSFGLKQINTIGSKALNGGNRLSWLNLDGSMDAVISINLLKHIIPEYDKMSFTEAKQWLVDHNIIGNNSNPMAIGYRIPTQGLSSISPLKIVDILPENVGDTIVLPDEFTAQTGSDFDIDKLYIARYNYDRESNKILFNQTRPGESFEDTKKRVFDESTGYYELKDEERLYNEFIEKRGDPKNIYELNSKEANENLLIDTYMAVLTDNKNVTETRLPLDKTTGIIKNEILKVIDFGTDKTKEIPLYEVSPTYQMDKKYEYTGGKIGIAPFALNNKNHVLTQLSKLVFAGDPLLSKLGFTGLHGINSRDEFVFERDFKNGDSNSHYIVYDEKGRAKYKKDKGLGILDWLSAMINAHVDVAKDPYVIRLNVNQYTYNMCNFLLRCGYGKATFYFLPQPILREMAAANERAQGIYGVTEGKSKTSIVNDEIKKVINKYYDNVKKAYEELDYEVHPLDYYEFKMLDSCDKIMNIDLLINALLDSNKIDSMGAQQKCNYYESQLLIAYLFDSLNKKADDVSKLVHLSQIDTKKYGNNFVDQDRFYYRLKSLFNTTSLFNPTDLHRYYDQTFLMTKLKYGVIAPAQMFNGLLLRSNTVFKNQVTNVLQCINKVDSTDSDLNKTISNQIEGQLRYKFLHSKDVNISDYFLGYNTMAQRLSDLKSKIFGGVYPELLGQDGSITNMLLNKLDTLSKMSTDEYQVPSVITKNRFADDDKQLKQYLKTSWEELAESEHPEIIEFAMDLFYYQLATTAGNFTKNGIFQLVPLSIIKDSGYAEYMGNATTKFKDSNTDFDDLFVNNWTDNNLVPIKDIKKTKFSEEEMMEIKVDKYPTLTLPNGTPLMILPNGIPTGTNAGNIEVYQPYIKVRIAKGRSPKSFGLYKYVGNVTRILKNGNQIQSPLYVLVNKKGLNDSGRIIKEYGDRESMFEFNKMDGALDAQSTIDYDTLKALLSLSKNERAKKIFDEHLLNLHVVSDYRPTTRTMYLDLINFAPREVVKKTTYGNITIETVEQVDQTSTESFTFKDGTSVNIPFKLNDEQQTALLTLEEFIHNPSRFDNKITLQGYAGTGKTTILGIFNKYLEQNFIRPLFSSPTHRANGVTKMNNPNAKVATLHSVFGLNPMIDLTDNQYDLRRLKTEQVHKPAIKDGELLIIDESSMITEELKKFIDDASEEKDLSVIYVGDPEQLKAVGAEKVSSVFDESANKQLKLDKVERTGDNPILSESTNLRRGGDLSYKSELKNGKGVEYYNDESKSEEKIKQIVSTPEFHSNPLHFRILSAKNDKLQYLNTIVRQQLFGKEVGQIVVGDIMMGYGNVSLKEGNGETTELIRNSVDYIVTKVTKLKKKTGVIDGVTLIGYDVTIQNVLDDSIQTVFVLDESKLDKITLNKIVAKKKELNILISRLFASRQFKMANDMKYQLMRIDANTISMKDYYIGENLVYKKSLDYGYAHTIHKSQGGTYDKVLIYADTIENSAFTDDDKRRLKYVAVSRAKDNVYVVTSNPITELVEEKIESEVQEQEHIQYSTDKPLCHSGGAYGADTVWGETAKQYGIETNHYYNNDKTPQGNFQITSEDATEGAIKVAQAAKANWGYQYGKMKDNLLIRNWAQVKYSDEIFAIGTLVSKGKRIFSDQPNDKRLANQIAVTGGTGYAVEMGIQAGKTVYVFDQDRNQWFKNQGGTWTRLTETPTIQSLNFAGIGTRNIRQNGVDAIKEVMEKSFGNKQKETIPQSKTQSTKTSDTQASEWSQKEGWSIDRFNKNVLPKIDEAWQVEFKIAPDQTVKPDFKGTMNFDYDTQKADGIKSTSTIEAIKNGERTATTRYESDGHMDYWKKVKVGDIIEYTRPGHEPVKVVVTKPFTKLQQTSAVQSTYNNEDGIYIMSLYNKGIKQIKEELSNTELTPEQQLEYYNAFIKELRDNKINTEDGLAEQVRKFICNL